MGVLKMYFIYLYSVDDMNCGVTGEPTESTQTIDVVIVIRF